MERKSGLITKGRLQRALARVLSDQTHIAVHRVRRFSPTIASIDLASVRLLPTSTGVTSFLQATVPARNPILFLPMKFAFAVGYHQHFSRVVLPHLRLSLNQTSPAL